MFTYVMMISWEAQAVGCRWHLDIDVAVDWVGKFSPATKKAKANRDNTSTRQVSR
ncbi:hypothetical protein JVT61DRAFT_12364 [Boletus reticuloceps]|uniref:Uncharacterized protein n=1 Tax=Boletus reticuloceps TaxID=495285 RepID=A0A8I2YEA6_9AGAM|nr:hypothetical protein JVT61DRAFT_12309 [Boletus reticuloceps]KAG6370213.1 hypothetical protein JVT61DRAFT_12364 [Boletus reticuloceps]